MRRPVALPLFLRTPRELALTVFFLAMPAFAQQLGSNLLGYIKTAILLPLGVFSILIALGASIFRPDMVKGAIYAAIICAVMYFIIAAYQSNSLNNVFQ